MTESAPTRPTASGSTPSGGRTTTPRRPEGAKGLRGRLAFTGFGQDPLGFVERLAQAHPGAARLSMPGLELIYLSDPAAIDDVLMDRQHLFTKDWTTRALRAVLGNGLFTAEGDVWRRNRGLVAPPLQRKRVADYTGLIVRRAERYADGVGASERARILDVKPDMTRLTMEIVAEALFGTDIGDVVPQVAAALEEALAAYEQLMYTWRRFVPPDWNQPVRKALSHAGAVLGGIVDRMVAEKLARPDAIATSSDVISRLLSARDEHGQGLAAEQVRDEVVTMLLAGHETTAMALTFALSYLARDPALCDSVAAEAIAAHEGLAPGALPDPARMPLARAVFKETLRIRPPLWLFGREAGADTVVGDWAIAKGEQLLVSPWLMHHDPRWFTDPWTFKVSRWLEPGFEESLPRNVYLPFGGGPRICAGLHLAMLEGTLVLSAVCRRYRLTPAGLNAEVPLNAGITLRPRGSVPITFHPR